MTPEEAEAIIRSSEGRRVRVTWSHGEIDVFLVGPSDEDGFLHSDVDCKDPFAFWTQFWGMVSVEVLDETT